MVIPVLVQDAVRVALWVVILFRFQRPDEGHKPDAAEKQRNRNERAEDIHRYFSRRALSETVIDDSDIASAAASGVASPTSASGTAMML